MKQEKGHNGHKGELKNFNVGYTVVGKGAVGWEGVNCIVKDFCGVVDISRGFDFVKTRIDMFAVNVC